MSHTALHSIGARLAILLVAANVLGCTDATAPLPRRMAPKQPRTSLEGDIRPDVVHNRYVVVFRSSVTSALEASAALVAQTGGVRFYVYETALKGFAVANISDAGVELLRLSPLVLSVEKDHLMRPKQGVQTFSYPADTGMYHLDRIDQHPLPLDWTYNYDNSGAGAHIYIIDSGIRGGHQEWGYGRIGASAAFIKWSIDPSPTIDQLGHGTMVASIAAGGTIGVAKNATLHSVRINDGGLNAYESDIVAGMDWIAGHRNLPAVANLSYDNFGYAIGNAAYGLMRHGVGFVTAGETWGVPVCNETTRIGGVITVGATNVRDERAMYSTEGECLDLFAPGGEDGGYGYGYGLLKVATSTDNGAYVYNYGTSFSSPVVAGVAALVLQQNSSLSPDALEYQLGLNATQGVVTNVSQITTTRRLAYSRMTVPPPQSYPYISISGPNSIASPGDYTWYGVVGGTTESYTVIWDKSLDDGETWSQVGEGDNYSLYEGTGGPHNIIFRATLLTQNQTASSTDFWVYVDTSCGGNIC